MKKCINQSLFLIHFIFHMLSKYWDDGHCWICQQNLNGQYQRILNRDMLRKFVKDKCQPTPFLYTYLLSFDLAPILCTPCVNWKRRCIMGTLTRSSTKEKPVDGRTSHAIKKFPKPLLQIDQLIMYFLQPGRYQLPDKRCLCRLMFAMRDTDSLLSRILPMCVRSMIAMTEGDTDLDIVRAWWQYNNKTHFLRHAATARLVRAVIKMDENKKMAQELGILHTEEETLSDVD